MWQRKITNYIWSNNRAFIENIKAEYFCYKKRQKFQKKRNYQFEKKFHKKGYFYTKINLPSGLYSGIRYYFRNNKKINPSLSQNAFMNMNYEVRNKILPILYPALEKTISKWEEAVGGYLQVNWLDIQYFKNGSINRGSSFCYHIDDVLPGIYRGLIYLHRCDEWNGAIKIFDKQTSAKLVKKGLWYSSSPGEKRAEVQEMILDFSNQPICLTGDAGTAVIFELNQLHKANMPVLGRRYAIALGLELSEKKQSYEDFIKKVTGNLDLKY